MRGRASPRGGAWSVLPGRRVVHARGAARRPACFLGLVRAERVCTGRRSGLLGGSSAGFRRRLPPWEFGSPRRLRSLASRHPVSWRGRSGGFGEHWCARVKPRVSGAQGLVSRFSRVLDLRPAEGRFREGKVKGVAAFRFSEGCRILEGRKTSKSAVRFVWPASWVDRGRSCQAREGRPFGAAGAI